jgi:hypothetical protein
MQLRLRLAVACGMRTVLLVLLVACGSKSPAPAPGPGTGSAPPSADACPAPKATTDVCAAVITYAKTAGGKCCEYPSPCSVPLEGQQYSDGACTQAMGPTP